MVAATKEFLEFLLAERGASANTVIAYDQDLRQLARYFRERLHQPGEIAWSAVDRTAVAQFTQHLKERGYMSSSVARKVAVMRGFFAFLVARGIIPNNPTADLSLPSLIRPLPKPPKPGEIMRLIEQPGRRATPEAKRDVAMLELLYATGMRVSELVSLDVGSVQLGVAPTVRCPGTEPKSRTLRIGFRAADSLRSYMERARPALVLDRKETALFVNRRGERLSRQGFWLNFKKYVRAAGLSSAITPNMLRYGYAGHMLREGMPLYAVQEILGHSNISTTRGYLGFIHVHQRRPAPVLR